MGRLEAVDRVIERDKAELPHLELHVPLTTGGIGIVRVELDMFVQTGRIMLTPTQKEDPKARAGIMAIAALGGLAVKAQLLADTDSINLTDEEQQRIRDVLNFMDHLIKEEHWKKPDDPVFSAIYHLLQQRVITRAQAVDIATPRLESPKTAEQDAFRSRVNRWATGRGLPLLGQTKRTPRTLSGRKFG